MGSSLHDLLEEARMICRISSFFASFSSPQFMLVFLVSSVWRSMFKFLLILLMFSSKNFQNHWTASYHYKSKVIVYCVGLIRVACYFEHIVILLPLYLIKFHEC